MNVLYNYCLNLTVISFFLSFPFLSAALEKVEVIDSSRSWHLMMGSLYTVVLSVGWMNSNVSLIIETKLINLTISSSYGYFASLSTSRMSGSSKYSPFLNFSFCSYKSVILSNINSYSLLVLDGSHLTKTGLIDDSSAFWSWAEDDSIL